jgi:hypothetical protein
MTPHQSSVGCPLPSAYTGRMHAWGTPSVLDPYPPHQKGSTT